MASEKRDTPQKKGEKIVAVVSDSEPTIRRMAHLEPGPGQRLARRIDRKAWSLLAHGIATDILCVLRHPCIPGHEEADHQANLSREPSASSVIEQPYPSASNSARQ